MSTADDDRKKKTHRSPAYPSMDLMRAVEYAEIIYKHEKRTAAPVSVVASHCGTDISSSKGLRLIAALKQYGLVVEEGSNEDRRVRLTDRALDIVLSNEESVEQFESALEAAALAPPIHKKIWENFGGKLPSDATLRVYLIRQLDFNDAYADGFIKQFRRTLEFASLPKADKMPESGGSQQAEETAMQDENPKQPASQVGGKYAAAGAGFSAPKPPAGTRDFPLYTSGAKGALYVPERMSKKDYDLLKLQIQNSLAVIEATAVVDEQAE